MVAGPVVVHTGGGAHFQDLIRGGFVDVLLAETRSLCTTSSRRCLAPRSVWTSTPAKAIEGATVITCAPSAPSLAPVALKAGRPSRGVLTAGVMCEVIKHNVDYVLAGSIRDDGPLPDALMDLRVAQGPLR